jgi:hypothetical protein
MSIEETIELAVQRAVAPLHTEIAEIKAAVCYRPDETIISDDTAAKMKGVSIATLRRMKVDGRVNSVATHRGRMCRVCDVE